MRNFIGTKEAVRLCEGDFISPTEQLDDICEIEDIMPSGLNILVFLANGKVKAYRYDRLVRLYD